MAPTPRELGVSERPESGGVFWTEQWGGGRKGRWSDSNEGWDKWMGARTVSGSEAWLWGPQGPSCHPQGHEWPQVCSL